MIPDNLLPLDLQQTAFIAGGWAACPALVDKIDIWALVSGGEPLADARLRVLQQWGEARMLGVTPLDTAMHGITFDVLEVALVARGVLPNMKAQPIRVRLTNAKTLMQVLEGFGPNYDAVAIDRRARVFTAPRYGSYVLDQTVAENLQNLWGV